MEKKITFEDKDKFGAPPVNLFTDADANEIKTTVNELANDVGELEGKIAALENNGIGDNGVVEYFTPVIDFSVYPGTIGETAPSYSRSGYYVKNGNVITLWLKIAITIKGDYTGEMALRGLPDYKPKEPTLLNVLTMGMISTLNNKVAVINDDFIAIMGTDKDSGADALFMLENIANNSSLIISGSYIIKEEDD